MPLAAAAKAGIIIAPILLAAGIAIYDANREDIHHFIHERIDDFREIAEELGLRERRHAQAWGAASGDQHRRSRSIEAWLRRRAAGNNNSGVELNERRRRRSSSSNAEVTRATGLDEHDARDGLKRRKASEGATSSTDHKNNADANNDGEEAPLPNPFDDTTALDTHTTSHNEPTTPLTPSTMEIHTPTSEDDPFEFDPLDTRSEVSLRTTSAWSELDGGARTPTSEDGADRDIDVERMSMASSWSHVSSREHDVVEH